MRGLLAVGQAPKTRAKFGLIPVDYAAEAIVKIGQMADETTGKIYHLSHSTVVRLQNILLELYEIYRTDSSLQLTSDIKNRIIRLVETGCGRREGANGELTKEEDSGLGLTHSSWWKEVEKTMESLPSPSSCGAEETEERKSVVTSLLLFADGIPSDVEPESVSCINTTTAMENRTAPDAGAQPVLRVWLRHLLTSKATPKRPPRPPTSSTSQPTQPTQRQHQGEGEGGEGRKVNSSNPNKEKDD